MAGTWKRVDDIEKTEKEQRYIPRNTLGAAIRPKNYTMQTTHPDFKCFCETAFVLQRTDLEPSNTKRNKKNKNNNMQHMFEVNGLCAGLESVWSTNTSLEIIPTFPTHLDVDHMGLKCFWLWKWMVLEQTNREWVKQKKPAHPQKGVWKWKCMFETTSQYEPYIYIYICICTYNTHIHGIVFGLGSIILHSHI